MTHCIDIENGELVAFDGATPAAVNIHGLLTVKTFAVPKYKLMSDNRIYNIYNNEPIDFFTDDTNINFDRVNIVCCNKVIVIFTYDNNYYCTYKGTEPLQQT